MSLALNSANFKRRGGDFQLPLKDQPSCSSFSAGRKNVAWDGPVDHDEFVFEWPKSGSSCESNGATFAWRLMPTPLLNFVDLPMSVTSWEKVLSRDALVWAEALSETANKAKPRPKATSMGSVFEAMPEKSRAFWTTSLTRTSCLLMA